MKDLKTRYQKEIVPALRKEYNIENIWSVPKVQKVIVHMGLGDALKDSSLIEKMQEIMQMITGQKPLLTRARKSEAGFNLRAGDIIGMKVTLRRDRMWYFLDKLAHIVLPSVKDFQGLDDRKFDDHGNYTFGLNDLFVFPEIDPTKTNIKIRGLAITMTISNGNAIISKEMLSQMGFLFKVKIAKK